MVYGCVMIVLMYGFTAADVAKLQAQRDLAIEEANLPNLFPDAAMSKRDKAAEALHGRFVCQLWNDERDW